MPTLWTTDGPGGGGALYNSVVAPNGQDLWVSSDMSGIYHSRDFGQSWQMVNFHGSAGGMNGGTTTQVQFTSDPNVVYVVSSSINIGKSTDDGATWTPLSGWTNGTAYWIGSDLSTTSTILVSNGANLYLSTNGGASFTSAYTSSNLYVAGAFFDGSNVYVGTNKGLLTSSNGGASFGLAAQQPGQTIMSFTGAKQGSTVRLLALTTSGSPSPDSRPWSLTYGGLYRLDVGGSWVNKSSAIPSGEDPHFVSMAQNNISIAYTGGAGLVSGYYLPQVLKTSNGGDAWSDTYFLWPQEVTPNVPNANVASGYVGTGGDFDWGWSGSANGFSVCPTDANRAIICENFTHVTTDGGVSWHQTYESQADSNPAGQYTPKHDAYHGVGLTETSVHYIDWMSPTNIMASYTDIDGWRSTDGGASWSHPNYNGVVSNTLYKTQYSGGLLYGATSNVHDLYVSTHLTDASCNPSWQTGAVVVSADQGATWSNIHSFGVPIIWIQIDPNNANRMYATAVDGVGSSDAGANGGIWVTNNLNLGASSTWTKLTNPPRTQGHPYDLRVLNDGTLVATYSGRMASNVFTDSSGVFVSTDGGTTWVDRSSAEMHWYTKEITIDPTDPTQSTWYAGVFNGWGGGGANDRGDLYRTTDRGVTWTKMNLGSVIPTYWGSISVQSVTINAATREMYVTTESYGILYAPDVTVPGFSATNFSDVTSFPFMDNERVFINPYNSQDVWVASFGGGIVRGGVAPSALAATAISSTQINLTWSDNSTNETGFAIDRATDAAFTQNVVTTTVGQNATSASINGLNPTTLYYFRVRATNGANQSANSSSASATTLSANRAPTDIALSASSIAENQPVGTAVGTLSTTDPDVGNTFTYSLVSGTGSTDNASFTISGGTLQTAAVFNYETKNSYSIRVRTTDQGGLSFEKTFTISVLNVAEVVPTITGISTDTGSSSSDGITSDRTLLINGTSEPGMTITVYRGGVLAGTTSANGSGNWVFDYTGTSLGDGSYSFTATASDTLGHTTAASAPYAVTIDTAAPRVTAVYVKGSTWTSGFLSFLAANLSGSSSTYGFAIPVGSGSAQLQTLPWRNIDRISVAFSEDVSVAQAQFAIAGSVGSYSVSGFSYNATDHVATWSLSAVIGPDKLYIALPGSGTTPVADVAGNLLDGEWTNPTSYSQAGATDTFPSGNGVAGGDFAFRFDVLPGDSTGGSLGKVNVADIAQTKRRSSLPETVSSYRSDFDGNGLINVADIAYVKSKSSIYSLPLNPPDLPVFG